MKTNLQFPLAKTILLNMITIASLDPLILGEEEAILSCDILKAVKTQLHKTLIFNL